MYRVVLVDDEPLVLEGLSLMLGRTGLPVETALCCDNGPDALRYISAHPVDIVFTDIRMPEMSGLELAQRLHETRPGLKLIILSGYSDFSYAQESIRCGVKDYLLKPVKSAALRETVERVIGQLRTEHDLSPALCERMSELLLAAAWDGGESTGAFLDYWQTMAGGMEPEPCRSLWLASVRGMIRLASREYGWLEGAGLLAQADFLPRPERMRACIETAAAARRAQRERQAPSILRALQERLEECYAQDLSLEEFAAGVGYNASYVSQLFKAGTGASFTLRRNELRVEQAKKLLASTDLPITEIAMRVGFNDAAYFIRVFKRLTRQTPRDYRKIHA